MPVDLESDRSTKSTGMGTREGCCLEIGLHYIFPQEPDGKQVKRAAFELFELEGTSGYPGVEEASRPRYKDMGPAQNH